MSTDLKLLLDNGNFDKLIEQCSREFYSNPVLNLFDDINSSSEIKINRLENLRSIASALPHTIFI